MNASVISIEKLSHRYHRQWAIKDISITVEKTGIYGLLGANGAGKSTLMNILCGVIAPTSGMVQIKGVNIRLQPIEAKKHIGFLPQNPPLLKELTIREYLGFAADLRFIPASKRAAMIEAAMEKCHLTHYQNRLIKNLSGGFQQRVGIDTGHHPRTSICCTR
ncbi:MAG: ABC transporter ATP-binding protein [Chitinophagaceae bacterium]|nr:ABC transporter ATP-binding protein [Chitinophagaceae bacterium]